MRRTKLLAGEQDCRRQTIGAGQRDRLPYRNLGPGAVKRVGRRREPVRRIQRWRYPSRPAIGRTRRLRVDEPKTPVLRLLSRLWLLKNDISDPETGDWGT